MALQTSSPIHAVPFGADLAKRGIVAILIAVAATVITAAAFAKTERGTPGRDKLVGTKRADKLIGRAGSDKLLGRLGSDLLKGGKGRDRLFASRGNDVLKGGPANDLLKAGKGNDVLLGGPANDVLKGGPGDDDLTGGRGSNTLNGGPGDDLLIQGPDGGTMTGGPGHDQFNELDGVPMGGAGDDVIDARDGNEDEINCGDGKDVAIVDASEEGVIDCETVSEPTARGERR